MTITKAPTKHVQNANAQAVHDAAADLAKLIADGRVPDYQVDALTGVGGLFHKGAFLTITIHGDIVARIELVGYETEFKYEARIAADSISSYGTKSSLFEVVAELEVEV